jgi:hypothetical protein
LIAPKAYSAYPALCPYALRLSINPLYIAFAMPLVRMRRTGKAPKSINEKSHPLKNAKNNPENDIAKDISICANFSPQAL